MKLPKRPPRRLGEGASDHTINKELVTLRTALKLAKRAGLWRGDVAALMPDKFTPEYKPRYRFVTEEELKRLLLQLTSDHAAAVAFMVATSAEWGAVTRARREDVSILDGRVLLRGTKRASRERVVPLVTEWQKSLGALRAGARAGDRQPAVPALVQRAA